MEQIIALLEKMATNDSFWTKGRPMIKKGRIAEFIKHAKKIGFVFDEADWQQYMDWKESLTTDCWFKAAGEPQFRYGAMRTPCGQFACKALSGSPPIMHQCDCWATDVCIENWHWPKDEEV